MCSRRSRGRTYVRWGMLAAIDLPAGSGVGSKTRHAASLRTEPDRRHPYACARPARAQPVGDGELEGWSAMQAIETSSIPVHADEVSGQCFVDIFSCRPFDSEVEATMADHSFRRDGQRSQQLRRLAISTPVLGVLAGLVGMAEAIHMSAILSVAWTSPPGPGSSGACARDGGNHSQRADGASWSLIVELPRTGRRRERSHCPALRSATGGEGRLRRAEVIMIALAGARPVIGSVVADEAGSIHHRVRGGGRPSRGGDDGPEACRNPALPRRSQTFALARPRRRASRRCRRSARPLPAPVPDDLLLHCERRNDGPEI